MAIVTLFTDALCRQHSAVFTRTISAASPSAAMIFLRGFKEELGWRFSSMRRHFSLRPAKSV